MKQNNKTWLKFLQDLQTSQYISFDTFQTAKEIINFVIANYCVVPSICRLNDKLQIVWDLNEHHLEIDVFSLNFDWFYRNRITENLDGEDNCAFPFNSKILEYVKMFK
jgi:hypothetical protein